MERMVGDWCLGSPIGSGSFAIVWKAKHKVTGQESAIKEINLDKLNAKLQQSLESEVSILKRINHDNIVKLLEVFEEKSKLYLIMEYCAGGDLAHYIRAHKRVPEAVAQHFMQQLAAGLREMWAHHLVHRDLKPQNLLLEGPGPSARLKIADFGFARNLQPQGLAETLCGSPLYMAPEILHFHKYDAKADLWSVGAILFELVAGRPPFNGANQLQLLRNIERGEARLPDVVATQLSLPCRQLIHALLRRNPVERISFEEFFRHPFLTGPPPPAPLASPFGLPAQLGRSASANSIPQQVLGFKQQAAPVGAGEAGGAGGLGGAGGIGGVGPAAAPLAPPVVGQLSNQLKPRRSLDLDGIAQRAQQAQQAHQAQQLAGGRPAEVGQRWAPAAAAPLAGTSAPARELAGTSTLGAQLAALSAHHQNQQQQLQQQQQIGRQLLGNGWAQQFGLAGGLGRPAGAQYPQPSNSVGLGRAPQPFTQPGSAPANVQPLLLTPFLPRPLAQPAVQPGQQPGPAAPAVPSPPRPLGTGSAGSAAAGPAVPASAAVPPGAQSAHSIDDDYVLVDTVLSSRNEQHSPAPPTSPPASATNSLDSSLHARPVDEVFTVGASGEPPCCAGGEGGALVAGGPSPAWLPSAGTPRWQLLRRAAHAMEHLCGAAKPEQQPAQCLSLCLAALQLLEHALDALPAPAPGGVGNGGGDGAAPAGTTAGVGTAAAVGLGDRSESRLREDVARVLSRAQAAAAALARQAAMAAGNGREGPNGSGPAGDSKAPSQGVSVSCQAAAATLPDPWELCYSCSLALAKEAAVDELLGNQERSLQLYAKACYLLHFMCVDGPELALEPPLQLTRQDRARLQRYAAATSARWAACKGLVGGEQAAVAPAVMGM